MKKLGTWRTLRRRREKSMYLTNPYRVVLFSISWFTSRPNLWNIKPNVSPWKFVWPNSTAISWHVTLPYLFYSCLQYDCWWLLISPFIYCQMCASRILNQKMQPPKSTLWGRHPVLPVQKCLYHPVALCKADHFARSLHENV